MAGLMWREHAASSWRMKKLIPLNRPHAHLTKIQKNTSGTLCFGPSGTARLHLSLFRSSVMLWSRSGRKYPRTPCIVSGACPDVVRHGYKHLGGHTN